MLLVKINSGSVVDYLISNLGKIAFGSLILWPVLSDSFSAAKLREALSMLSRSRIFPAQFGVKGRSKIAINRTDSAAV